MGDYNNDPFMRGGANNNAAAVQARTKQQNRANLMQMKLIGQSHPTGLTNNLLKLFEPRPPLEYKPPPEKRKCPPYTGMAQFVSNFAEPADPEYAPPIQKGETPGQKKARIHQLRLEEGAKKAAEELEKYDPNSDPNISGDPYKTLFVARLNYETTESRIKRDLSVYKILISYDDKFGLPTVTSFIWNLDFKHIYHMISEKLNLRYCKCNFSLLMRLHVLLPTTSPLPTLLVSFPCFISLIKSQLQDFEILGILVERVATIQLVSFKYLHLLSKTFQKLRRFSVPGKGRVRLIADKESNKPRGYAFIEYMHTRDMKAAYKQADGRKIDNRRVLVDVERGRTVPNWRPRRLGGGLGTSRVGGEEVNQRVSGREQSQSGGPTRSVEPRATEERDRDREKSRERVKEREREKSRERSHDRPRDREHREDRHHRDRDRKSDRDRDRSGRDRDRHRDRDRDRSGRDRSGRDRDRYRDKDREGDVEHMDRDHEHDRGRSRDKEYEYDRVDRHERDKHGDRQKSYDRGDPEEMYDQPVHGNAKPADYERDPGGYDDYYDQERYEHQDRDHDGYYQMEEDNYEPGQADPHDKDYDRSYRQSDRSLSREYEY
ncbi:hypothetical protein M8C21_018129 [Ambrosia artemisiifolia]|uniref:U1 small nuclear ribonucleoprotein 70 kDa n=1 Tax=Ambrosia artemisiifolia TaxID=4212 RepID=A0AAD5GL27_AMBAR|nr:hypothetical protein M8C21_018129 [Ambrosia artemisiifolia]